MNNKAFPVSLSLTENNIRIVRGLVQYDDANLFDIQILSNGEAFDFTGYTDIVLSIRKPDGTSIVTDLIQDGDTLQSIDQANGRLAFLVGGQGTVLVGMHFCTLAFYGDGLKATTAKMNYFVAEALDFEGDMSSTNNWPIIDQLIASNSLIQAAEALRVAAENARVAAENERVSETAGIIAAATALASAAQQYADISKDWAGVAFATAIPGKYWWFEKDDLGNLYINWDETIDPDEYTLPAISQEQLQERLAAINCGVFGTPVDKIQILRGLLADIPVLADGEMAWATDTKDMYVGQSGTNQKIMKPGYIAQATTPADTTLLWIDTDNSNVIKFYNGSAWVATAAATFS